MARRSEESTQPQVTPGVVRLPTSGLSGAVSSALQSEDGFSHEDIMVMAAITSVGTDRSKIPAPYQAMLELAFAHLGIPPDADDEAIKEAVRVHIKANPVSPDLLAALERFRNDMLQGELTRGRKAEAGKLLGQDDRAMSAPTVPSPKKGSDNLTAGKLLQRAPRTIR
ncbi:MAG: hypothetical protein AAFN74_02590 [Myxococcota bacterium]